MSALRAASVHVIIAGAAFAAFLCLGTTINFMTGAPAADLWAWTWTWAGVSSITLAITLATFLPELLNVIETTWARSPKSRGRHVSSGGYYAAHSDADPEAPHPTAAFQPYPNTRCCHARR